MDAASNLANQISARLRTARFGRPLQVHTLVTSTNDVAQELASGGAGEGTAVVALEQSRGRGRLGRRWESPPGGLYLSIVLRPSFPMARWPLIGLACSLGAAAAAEVHGGAPVRVKWPNDLLLDGKKLGGVLVETTGDAAVCGIGLNVIPSWVRVGSPGSVQPAAGAPSTRSGPSSTSPSESPNTVATVPAQAAWLTERNPSASLPAIVLDLLLECERRYDSLKVDPAPTLTEWRAKSVTLGGRVYIEGTTPIEGIAEDIDMDGALLVRVDSGLRRVVAGAITNSGGRGEPPAS
ncbi:MAG TPA: biotin--[acetyl-CoA-carboxylase] ligase [bacterium]